MHPLSYGEIHNRDDGEVNRGKSNGKALGKSSGGFKLGRFW